MFRILLLKLIFSGIIVLFLPTLLSANQSPDLKIIAIVLSKTCPLPDGPDMTIDSPDSIIKSVNNPDCPKHGDTQLVQTAIANHAKIQIKVGVEIKVRVDNQELKKKGLRKVYTIQARDTTRVLHDIDLGDPGLYQISVRVWDAKFKRILINTTAGDERYFFVASHQDVEVAKTQLASGVRVSGKNVISPLRFDPPDLRWESVQVLPKHSLRGEKLKLRLNLMNAGGDIVRDILTKVQYYNVKQPMRKSVIAMPSVHVMAPGEITTFDLEYILPDDQLLGKYQIIATVDPDNEIEELKEKNNAAKSNVINSVILSSFYLLINSLLKKMGFFFFSGTVWLSVNSKFKLALMKNLKTPDHILIYRRETAGLLTRNWFRLQENFREWRWD